MSGLVVFPRFMLDMLVCCFVYLAPLEKRERFWQKVVVGSLACIALGTPSPITEFTYFVRAFALLTALVYWCCELTAREALYCVSCAYTTQHLASNLNTLLRIALGWGRPQPTDSDLPSLALQLGIRVVCCAIGYFVISRALVADGRYTFGAQYPVTSMVLVLSLVLLLSELSKWDEVEANDNALAVFSLYAIFACGFFLWAQVIHSQQMQTQEKLELERLLSQQRREQYELSKENITIINQKSHDLKKQLSAIESFLSREEQDAYLSKIKEAIQIYDSTINTGNKVIDTVLTEKSLVCRSHAIELTYVVDGKSLAFMNDIDLYTMFRNALDNAIESVADLPDPESRMISVSVWSQGGLALCRFENYFEGDLDLVDGLPATSKKDPENHGFGLKSIQRTVKAYDGHMSLHTEDGSFVLCVSIPLPSSER